MDNNAASLDTLLQQAEIAAQRHGQQSRQTRRALSRRLERTDTEAVARQLDKIYRTRTSRLATAWRLAQQRALYLKESW